ncbi:MAG TPA: TAXI family TRAP transporter solute-binding subunit [Rhodospirillales bacterium]|nr:TAXI family TRAP transporter solute-binding subunit [Rhodospirillales bacterium]
MARRLWLMLLLVAVAVGSGEPAFVMAQEPQVRVMRIGTGPTGGAYFPIGGVLANLISSPPGSLSCAAGGSCGVPGLIASAITTQGSVDNIAGLTDGSLDMALVQADVANFAYLGKGPFANEPAHAGLRAIASLYAESVHVVTAAASPLAAVGDLRGKRVSLGAERSGTRFTAERILRVGYGLRPQDVKPVHAGLDQSSDMLAEGSIDAFFMVGGYPMASVQHAAEVTGIRLLPIDGKAAAALRKEFPFFTAVTIPAETYRDVPETTTLSVRAHLVVDASLREDLVFAITRALWLPETAQAMSRDLPETLRIRPEDALSGLALPLHPGAERYYREAGLLAQGGVRP